MIGAEFAGRLSPLASPPRLDHPMACDVCGAPNATCTGDVPPDPAPVVQELVVARAAQQTRRPPGRPPADPEKAAAKQRAHNETLAAQTAEGPAAVDADGREGVEPAAGLVPGGDPSEVRDLFVVPDGLVSPDDDPHRPDPATTVIVADDSQLVATGAWMSLPGGHTIAATRDVVRVFWPMGSVSPSYATVAARGAVLPKVNP